MKKTIFISLLAALLLTFTSCAEALNEVIVESSNVNGPAAPKNLKSSRTTSYSHIQLTWDAVDGADKYIVYMANGTSYKRLGEVYKPVCNLLDLDFGTYVFAVSAVKVFHGKEYEGNKSKDLTVIVSIADYQYQITDFQCSYRKDSNYKMKSISFSWEEVEGADLYEIFVYKNKKLLSESSILPYVEKLTETTRTSLDYEFINESYYTDRYYIYFVVRPVFNSKSGSGRVNGVWSKVLYCHSNI